MAYRRTEKIQSRLDETREQIVRAGRKFVAQNGFAKASMAEIARQAGVATGTLYKHFPNKDALICEIYRLNGHYEMARLADIAGQKDRPASARIEHAIRSFLSRAMQSRPMAYASLEEPAGAALGLERIKMRELHTSIYQRMIEDGIAAGEFAPQDPFVSASGIAGAVTASMIGPLNFSRTLTVTEIDHIIDGLVSFCLAGVKDRSHS